MSHLPARWSGAAVHGRPAERRAQLLSLPAGTPSVETLFTFMRDAELRFTTLRLRVLERTWTAKGDSQRTHDIVVRHPDRARVTVRYAELELPRDHDIWVTDGTVVRTYSALHDLATTRPVRRRVVGLDSPDLPATSRVYRPLAILPHASLAELMIHPAGFCQNVLGTGPVRINGSTRVAGREALTLVADHPRTAHVSADRADHSIELAVDVELGLVTRLVERLGDRVTRHAEAASVEADGAIADAAFGLSVPASTRRIY